MRGLPLRCPRTHLLPLFCPNLSLVLDSCDCTINIRVSASFWQLDIRRGVTGDDPLVYRITDNRYWLSNVGSSTGIYFRLKYDCDARIIFNVTFVYFDKTTNSELRFSEMFSICGVEIRGIAECDAPKIRLFHLRWSPIEVLGGI